MSRMKNIGTLAAAVFLGAMFGQIFSPQTATAVSREIVELQNSVNQLIQGQTDLRSDLDSKLGELRTIVNQSLDSQNRLAGEMGGLQKAVQDTQANAGSRVDTLATQSQGLTDNVQDLQARVGKVSQQLTDIQNLLQSIDSRVSGAAPAATSPSGMNNPPPATNGGSQPYSTNPPPATGGNSSFMNSPPVSSDTLYQNALRDLNSGKYDLSRQEFNDFLRNFPTSELAGNAQFYLGEIDYSQGDYQDALNAYDMVLVNYPKSYKSAAASLKKGEAMLALGQKANASKQFHAVVTRYPGTDEARRAQAHLREMTPRSAANQ